MSPGFINTHVHTGSNAGDYLLTEPDKPDFMGSNYLAHVAPLCGHHVAHHLETLDVSVRFSLIHMLKGGTTSFLDYGGAEKGPQDYVNLIEEVGIRCFTGLRHRDADYCFDATGRQQLLWNEERGAERFNKSIDFAKKFNGSANGLVTAMLFPGQVDTCTPETLRKTKEATKELGLRTQLHAAMNLLEFNEILRLHRCTPIQLLEKIGFLGPEISLGHCIFIAGHSWIVYPYADDLKIIADAGSQVSYSPLKYLTLGIVMEFVRPVSRIRHHDGDRHRHISQGYGVGDAIRGACLPRRRPEVHIRSPARRFQCRDAGWEPSWWGATTWAD